jgi:hypothetical protein
MTFVGFLLTALNFVMLSWYDWDFYASTSSESVAPVPNWFWGLAALNIFLAYTLGNHIASFSVDRFSIIFIFQIKMVLMENRRVESA